MAYITKATSLFIVMRTNVTKTAVIEEEIYKRDIGQFSDYENQRLNLYKKFLLEPEKYILEIYRPYIPPEDTYTWLFEGRASRYHKDIDCHLLLSDYQNIKIPEFIRNRGKKKVIEFRKWLKGKTHLIKKGRLDILQAHILDKYGMVVHIKELQEIPNSGINHQEDVKLEELESQIDNIIELAQKYYTNNPDKQKIIEDFAKKTFLASKKETIKFNNTGMSDLELKKFLKAYHKSFKQPLEKLLREYYRVYINPNLEFKGSLLEKLNLSPCSKCYSENNNKPTSRSANYLYHNENKHLLSNLFNS